MTKDDIIKIAKEAKMYAEYVTPQGLEWFDTYNERFAAFVAAAEREACAKVCDELSNWYTPKACATHIRARGNT